jgi:hypothetical protein
MRILETRCERVLNILFGVINFEQPLVSLIQFRFIHQPRTWPLNFFIHIHWLYRSKLVLYTKIDLFKPLFIIRIPILILAIRVKPKRFPYHRSHPPIYNFELPHHYHEPRIRNLFPYIVAHLNHRPYLHLLLLRLQRLLHLCLCHDRW